MVWAGNVRGAEPTSEREQQARTPAIGFVMEQDLGHRASGDNLRFALTAARRRAEVEFDSKKNAHRLVELALRCVRGT